MDAITIFALSIDNPIIRSAGMILQNPLTYAVVVLFLAVLGERRKEKLARIMVALLIAVIIVIGVKEAVALERPCFDATWCPSGYSFPSAHAAVAFTLMIAFMNKKGYPLYLVFALFVSFSRLNIGVHTFYDIAAALPVALISYYVAAVVYEKVRK